MNAPVNDPVNEPSDLHEVFADAVAHVEPADRLAAIRARTARRRPRHGWVIGGGAVLATAAAVTAIAVVATNGPERTEPRPAAPTTITDPTPAGTRTIALYFVGETHGERRVFREFRKVPLRGERPRDALKATVAALEAGPDDPDYRYPWPRGAYNVSYADGVVHAAISVAPKPGWDDPVAMQQLYRSLAAAVPDTPIVFNYDDGATFTVKPDFDLMSHLSISDPSEGTEVSGHLTARGVANGFEANVACRLIGDDGAGAAGKVFGPYVTTAAGWTAPKLFPWRMVIDLDDVPPGRYSLECSTDDPSGGAEGGRGADLDTRSLIVE